MLLPVSWMMVRMNLPKLDFSYLREQIVGVDSSFTTPFGDRMLVYCDYTASGRTLGFVEDYLRGLQRHYANTHTEDDVTGRSMTHLLHEAEAEIKKCVNAGTDGRIICTGTGATGAITHWQQILGVALAPATRDYLMSVLRAGVGDRSIEQCVAELRDKAPVVFVGPYEHHSNEVTWRESLAEVVPVKLDGSGQIDLDYLKSLLTDERYEGRLRIGSFSAASNVTGFRSPVRELSVLLHRHGALACFDYAASAPYVRIDMNPEPESVDEDPSIDAIFVSPHKFLGGPGSAGVLVFNQRFYRTDLGPTVGGGGTVDYVSRHEHDFVHDIEEREKAGTPGSLQVLKAALCFLVKEAAGPVRIEKREHELVSRAFARWSKNDNIEVLGDSDPSRRVAIVSFNLKCSEGTYLHPKFVTTLLNDLFGIQSRAGCSCAGPYGHRLLGIDEGTSQRYRSCILDGTAGIKPGWCRVGFHYVMDDIEADYVIDAIDFIAREGDRFLRLYNFEMKTGAWTHKDDCCENPAFSLREAMCATHFGSTSLSPAERAKRYEGFLGEARRLAEELGEPGPMRKLEGEAGELQFFALPG
ncbi:aminotransferase class V-fold PLP-dependent enzyme [bacterium]|nr:MAG: aminotransferase class V-fold PLP-dependent enzyme [bacterium]